MCNRAKAIIICSSFNKDFIILDQYIFYYKLQLLHLKCEKDRQLFQLDFIDLKTLSTLA